MEWICELAPLLAELQLLLSIAWPAEPSADSSAQGMLWPGCTVAAWEHSLRRGSKLTASARMIYQAGACHAEMGAGPTLFWSSGKLHARSICKGTIYYPELLWWDFICYCNKMNEKQVFIILSLWFWMQARWTRLGVCPLRLLSSLPWLYSHCPIFAWLWLFVCLQ